MARWWWWMAAHICVPRAPRISCNGATNSGRTSGRRGPRAEFDEGYRLSGGAFRFEQRLVTECGGPSSSPKIAEPNLVVLGWFPTALFTGFVAWGGAGFAPAQSAPPKPAKAAAKQETKPPAAAIA